MSEEEKKAVEANAAEAAAAEANAPTELEKQLADKDAEILRLSTEKENYRKGMLKAKGKLPKEDDEDEDDSEESVEDKVLRLVKENLLNTELNKAQTEKDELLKKALARNKELEIAVKNRTQISTADAGSSNSTVFTPKDAILTDEKIAKFKSMGWDDKKIELYKKNFSKLK